MAVGSLGRSRSSRASAHCCSHSRRTTQARRPAAVGVIAPPVSTPAVWAPRFRPLGQTPTVSVPSVPSTPVTTVSTVPQVSTPQVTTPQVSVPSVHVSAPAASAPSSRRPRLHRRATSPPPARSAAAPTAPARTAAPHATASERAPAAAAAAHTVSARRSSPTSGRGQAQRARRHIRRPAGCLSALHSRERRFLVAYAGLGRARPIPQAAAASVGVPAARRALPHARDARPRGRASHGPLRRLRGAPSPLPCRRPRADGRSRASRRRRPSSFAANLTRGAPGVTGPVRATGPRAPSRESCARAAARWPPCATRAPRGARPRWPCSACSSSPVSPRCCSRFAAARPPPWPTSPPPAPPPDPRAERAPTWPPAAGALSAVEPCPAAAARPALPSRDVLAPAIPRPAPRRSPRPDPQRRRRAAGVGPRRDRRRRPPAAPALTRSAQPV